MDGRDIEREINCLRADVNVLVYRNLQILKRLHRVEKKLGISHDEAVRPEVIEEEPKTRKPRIQKQENAPEKKVREKRTRAARSKYDLKTIFEDLLAGRSYSTADVKEKQAVYMYARSKGVKLTITRHHGEYVIRKKV
jgi:hypothetical protein